VSIKSEENPELFDNIEENTVSEIATISPQPQSHPAQEPAAACPGMVRSTVHYLMRTEVHTFAFSVAANSILSFFPFVVLLMTLIRNVFHSRLMYDVVVELLRDYLPAGQDFVIRNLNAMVNARHRVQIVSLIILLVTSSGIFLPLEVALNRIWRFPDNRSYFGNQLISLGLAFACGVLALVSIALTAKNVSLMESLLHGHTTGMIRLVGFLLMKVSAIAASIAIFFLIYWLLPNGKVPARAVLPAAFIMGLLFEALKYAYILALPRLDFQEVYGPFALSVSMMFWAFSSGLLLLAGANLSAEEHMRHSP
jgi:membrane protein